MGDKLLEVGNLSKKYGCQEALKGVSFAVEEGRITGLLGPNGSGKTTMIKIINGLISDYSGKVSVCGIKPGTETKKLVSYLPDKIDLPAWLKVKETVKTFTSFFRDFDEERAHEMLSTLSVPENKRISQLSKGMKEKLRLILAMSRRAKLYVLDEPIAGVDPASREVILSTILSNFGEGSSILLSTHIISDVETVFDDVLFLKDGEVTLFGDAEGVREQYGKSVDQLFREVYRC